MYGENIIMVLSLVLIISADTVSADLTYAGTYTYYDALAPEGYSIFDGDVSNAGPIDFTPASALGDGNGNATTASWKVGTSSGYRVGATFNLGKQYIINTITTTHNLGSSMGIGATYFYYSTNGVSFTLIGSDGDAIYAYDPITTYTRSIDAGGIKTQYIQVRVGTIGARVSALTDVQIDAAIPAPATGLFLLLGIALLFSERRNGRSAVGRKTVENTKSGVTGKGF